MNENEVIERLQNDLNGDEMLGTDVAICYKEDLKFILNLIDKLKEELKIRDNIIYKLEEDLAKYMNK